MTPGQAPNVIAGFTLDDALAEHRRARPEAVAAVCGDTAWSWAGLDHRVGALATGLVRLGVLPGDRILWLGQNCHRLLELLIAAGRLGAAFCPANWRQSPEELAFVIDDLEPRLVVWQEAEIGERTAKARALSIAAGAAHWLRHDGAGPGSYEALPRR